jgi:plasmid stabilization system protein ParE
MSGPYSPALTDEALGDLDRIYVRIAIDSPLNAERFVAKLFDRIGTTICDAPNSYRVAGKSRSTKVDVHAYAEWPYVIYYRVDEPARRVVVLTVRHGAQIQPSLFD